LNREDSYFQWLCALGGKQRTHEMLLTIMHQSDFIVLNELDRNRVEDGRGLRERYLNQTGINVLRMNNDCITFLEVVIALAEKMSFLTSQETDPPFTHKWFGVLLKNSGLVVFTDDSFQSIDAGTVREKIKNINFRMYAPDGNGGFFPLEKTHVDQRQVELWFQMQEWLDENVDIIH